MDYGRKLGKALVVPVAQGLAQHARASGTNARSDTKAHWLRQFNRVDSRVIRDGSRWQGPGLATVVDAALGHRDSAVAAPTELDGDAGDSDCQRDRLRRRPLDPPRNRDPTPLSTRVGWPILAAIVH